jgi:threonine dehydrogenase-like Zn-dependent dehydrogenase
MCYSSPLAIDLVARGLVDLKPLLTHTFKFTDALEAFEITKNGKDRQGKMVIYAISEIVRRRYIVFVLHSMGPIHR